MFKFQPKNILVTGGAGFIGSHFVRYLLNQYQDINIVNLDNLTYAGSYQTIADISHFQNHRFIKGDILDQELLAEIFQKYAINSVVHFAAESHVDRSIAKPDQFVLTNIVGTFYLLEAAKKAWEKNYSLNPMDCRFHHISTDEVYGSLEQCDPAFTEKSPYSPNSPYSASKASSDFLVRSYFKTYGLPITLSNCSNNFGPYQHQEKFIPTVIHACLNEQPIPIYGNGSNIRDWLYVEDHCEVLAMILHQATVGHCYNIGGENEISNLQLALEICSLLDEIIPLQSTYKDLISFVQDRAGHDWRYAVSTEKVKQELGWQPKNNFKQNLRKTVTWYVENFAYRVCTV
jgi:dTDP-glucose 4,6-dehydratase